MSSAGLSRKWRTMSEGLLQNAKKTGASKATDSRDLAKMAALASASAGVQAYSKRWRLGSGRVATCASTPTSASPGRLLSDKRTAGGAGRPRATGQPWKRSLAHRSPTRLVESRKVWHRALYVAPGSAATVASIGCRRPAGCHQLLTQPPRASNGEHDAGRHRPRHRFRSRRGASHQEEACACSGFPMPTSVRT